MSFNEYRVKEDMKNVRDRLLTWVDCR